MAFVRPTLPQLVTRIEADFVSRLALTGALLRRAMVRVTARVLAGAAHMMHGHLEYLGQQLFPDLSDDAFLVRQASLFGLFKVAASFATATVTVTGTNGTLIPGAPAPSTTTLLQRADGAEYSVNANATISGGTATLSVTARVAGALGSLTTGVALNFESPIVGVNTQGVVLATVADGADQESPTALRTRLSARMAQVALGGSSADYVAWTKLVAGVTRVWPTPLGLGPGTVVVRFVRDNDAGSVIPDAGEVAAVQAFLNTVAPAHVTVTAVAPVANPMAVTVNISPDNANTRAAVSASLADLVLRTAAPGVTVYLSAVRTAIGSAAGIVDYSLAMASDFTNTINQIATLGTVSFI